MSRKLTRYAAAAILKMGIAGVLLLWRSVADSKRWQSVGLAHTGGTGVCRDSAVATNSKAGGYKTIRPVLYVLTSPSRDQRMRTFSGFLHCANIIITVPEGARVK